MSAGSAQTKITPDKNKYKPAQDVELGRQAAAQAKKELPMLNDERVDGFVEEIGSTLVRGIPSELRHPEFRYTFDVVNQKEINAFALPGGPMFVNRGMIEAAKSEGEVAGVMAHEIAHVALRHGTAQATKGQKFQIGAVAGQILGAIVGGTTGSVIAQGSQFGLGAYFLKYGREYERQADLLGAQIMARAGYDPREMANMFKTIEAEGGRGGPEWLSDHPNPGNRYEAITREAASLRVEGNANTGDFQSTKARLRDMKPAYTAEQIAQGRARSRQGGGTTSAGRRVDVPEPSSQFRTYDAGDSLRISVPANWRPIDGTNTVTYAPDGAYFEDNGATAFTHGLEVGVTQGTGDLQRDTEQLLRGIERSNADLRVAGNTRRESIGGRQGLTTPLKNVSDVTGQPEYVALSTAQIADGNVLYLIGVAPQNDAQAYENVFRRVRQNVRVR
jgi:Peptidase family M48